MRTLAIIPARGGSKGVPRKNIRRLAGTPLLSYTAQAARNARRVDRVVVSTDDAEIADVARDCGLEVPFMRPPELAQDETPTLPVLQHAVRFLEDEGDRFDAICLLQPTNPFRTGAMIDGCLELLGAGGADSVVSVLGVPDAFNPCWVYFRDPSGMLRLSTGDATPIPRRQLLPPAYHRDGSVYAMKREVLMVEGSLYGGRLLGYLVDPSVSINIDTEEDWRCAEAQIARAASTPGELPRGCHPHRPEPVRGS